MLLFRSHKAFNINCKSVFRAKLLGKLKRIAVCFIKIICNFSRYNLLRIFHKIWKKLLEFGLSFFERCAEFCFLSCKLAVNFFRVLLKLRICALEIFNNNRSNFRKEFLFYAKLHSVSDRAPYQSAKNVARAYI